MTHSVARYDIGQVKGDASVSTDGYIKANAVVTRTGIFIYQNADGTIRKELRHPKHVWNDESIESMKMIPVTNGHPSERMVTPENFKRLSIGYTGETIKKDGEHVIANLVITDKEGVDAVIKWGRKELSLGYLVDLDETPGEYEGEKYDAMQTNIRYNHLAIVDKARAGESARIALDSDDAVEILKEDKFMGKRKIKIDEEEYAVEESVGDYIDRLEKDMMNLSDERDRVERELKMIREKLEKALVERDSFKDQVSEMDKKSGEKMDEANFARAVSERVKLMDIAKDYLGSGLSSKLDSMSNSDIKKEIIRTAKKTVSVDGKSQVYLDCMFDMICAERSEKKVNVDNVSYNNTQNNDATNSNPLVNAQQKMIQKSKSFINSKNSEAK